MFQYRARAAAAAAIVLASACAAPLAVLAAPREDPLEKINRVGFAVEGFLDRYLIGPIAHLYRALTPGPIGQGLHNAVVNLSEPVVAINDLLQARPKRAGAASLRFAFNSTIGLAGLIDVAGHGGIPHHVNSFGDTLGRYGVGPGPYLFLPLLGPSTVRDLFGLVVDGTSDPVHFANYPYRTELSTGEAVVGGLDLRARSENELKALLGDAADPYATLRSTWLQHRQSEIDEGRLPPALPDLGDSPAPAAGDQAAPLPELPDEKDGQADHHVAPTPDEGDGQGQLGGQAE